MCGHLHTKMQTSGSATAVSELKQKQNRLQNDCLVEAKQILFYLFKWFPKNHAIVHSQNHVPLSCGPAVKWYIIITSVQSIFSLQII